MTVLYVIAALAAIGVVAGVGYVVWCAATILSKGVDLNESFDSCPVVTAVRNLRPTNLRYTIVEESEADANALPAAQVEAGAVRVEGDGQAALALENSGPEAVPAEQDARTDGAGTTGAVPVPVRGMLPAARLQPR